VNKLVFPIAAALLSFAFPGHKKPVASAQTANVERQLGVGVYVCALPDRDYDTVCTISTKKGFNSYPGPSIPQYIEGIKKSVDALAKTAVKKSKKKKYKTGGKEINGIITRDGKTAVVIHFKTKIELAKTATANYAKVDKYKGYYLFIQNKPLQKYAPGVKIKFNNKLTMDNPGINSMYVMIDSLIQNYVRKKGNGEQANAIVTSTCIDAEFIKLTE
jgi:hypothetical protein